MTRHHGTVSIAALQAHCGIERLCVTNDPTAPALALPALPNEELHQAAAAAPVPDSAIALPGASRIVSCAVSGSLARRSGAARALDQAAR